MAKIALAATPRVLLDLYALEPGQAQKVHSHDAQDKIYVVLEGRGRFSVGGSDETLEARRGHRGGGRRSARRRQRFRPPGCCCSCSSRHRRRTRESAAARGASWSPAWVTCSTPRWVSGSCGCCADWASRWSSRRDQTCCGLPLFNSGHHREAAAVARRTRRPLRGRRSTWWCRRARAPGWSSTSIPG